MKKHEVIRWSSRLVLNIMKLNSKAYCVFHVPKYRSLNMFHQEIGLTSFPKNARLIRSASSFESDVSLNRLAWTMDGTWPDQPAVPTKSHTRSLMSSSYRSSSSSELLCLPCSSELWGTADSSHRGYVTWCDPLYSVYSFYIWNEENSDMC